MISYVCMYVACLASVISYQGFLDGFVALPPDFSFSLAVALADLNPKAAFSPPIHTCIHNQTSLILLHEVSL